MATLTLTSTAFEDTIKNNEIVLIDFWAAWCGPCKSFAPVFEKASNDNPDIVFAKVDTEDQQELAGSFQIMSIPTLMAFRDQILLYSQPGALPASALNSLIEQIRALDMDDVRKKVAETESSNK